MSTIGIAGGTGTLGALLVSQLRARGHDVRSLARGSTAYPVDLTTGRGLERALDGADVVIQAANGPASKRAAAVLVDGTKRLLDASTAHHVCAPIVGIEHVPAGYYRVKVAEEAVVRSSGRSWTIVRATQFHELLGRLVHAASTPHPVALGGALSARRRGRHGSRDRRRGGGAGSARDHQRRRPGGSDVV
jgi:uncharacterized protein YbjT (DUF2867 family)